MLSVMRSRYLTPVWAVLRIGLGWVWLSAAIEKLQAFPAYVGAHVGTAVAGFLEGALAQTSGAHAQVTSEWAWLIHVLFLPTAGFWSIVVTFGELAVGLGLIVGLFTGTALMAALVMNLAYMLSGSATVNPPMFALEVAMLAVGPAVAYWGLDHLLFHDWVSRHLVFRASASPAPAPTVVRRLPTPHHPRRSA